MTPLRSMLFTTDPYADFGHEEYPLDLHGWGSDHPVFRRILEEIRPRQIFEVGTWKGASAIHMANCCRDLGLEAEILCIDTWLGAVEFWNDHQDVERYRSLKLRHGYPSVYYQFLANVVRCGYSETITPFPQTSQIAARWLRAHALQADVIYIDGSHQEEDVLADLRSYWPLVRPGGLLFGDDFDEYWPGVRSAVRRFATEYGIEVDAPDRKWLLRKALDRKETEDGGDTASQVVATATRFEVISEQLVQIVHRLNAQESHNRTQDERSDHELVSVRNELQRAQEQARLVAAWYAQVKRSMIGRIFLPSLKGVPPFPLEAEGAR